MPTLASRPASPAPRLARAAAVVPLTDATVDAFTRENRLAVVGLAADGCDPCAALAPQYAELAREMGGAVAFGRIDADDSLVFASRHGVATLPTLLLYKDGAVVGRIARPLSKDRLRAHLDRLRHAGPAA